MSQNIERSSLGQRVTGHSFSVVLNFHGEDVIIHLARDSEGLIHLGLDDILSLFGLGEDKIDFYICSLHLYDYIGTIQVCSFDKSGRMLVRNLRSLPVSFVVDFLDELTEDISVEDDVISSIRNFLSCLALYYLTTIYHNGLEIYETA